MTVKEIDDSEIIRKKLERARKTPFKAYIDMTVGDVSYMQFLKYEILTFLLGPIPGGLGFLLRKQFYPILFKKVGKGLIIGRNITIRHPDKIKLGNNVTIDDNCLIDGRGAGTAGIVIEDNVIINRNSLVLAKAGPIHIGQRASIGSNSVIVSMYGVEIGESALMAGNVSLSAGSYHFEDSNSAVMDQGAYSRGPIRIGAKSWLGTGVIVLDGVTIGMGSVIGAGSVVISDIVDKVTAVGVPAKVKRFKGHKNSVLKQPISDNS